MACARQQTVLWARVLQQWLPAAAGTAGPPLAAGTGVSRRAHGAQLGAIASCLHRHAQRAQQHQLFSSSSWPWQSQWRHSSTAAVANTQQLLDSLTATRLHEELQDEAERRPVLSHDELLTLIIDRGGASNRAEAHERAAALNRAGVLLLFNNMAYLKPLEVTELVYKLLPSDASAAQATLSSVEKELARMDLQHRRIHARAKRWPRRWLFFGCAALAAQLVGFAYLTWWELSWDVMEPVAYMLSLSYSLLAYIYFLAVARGTHYFDQKDFKDYWEQQQLEKTMAAAGFDLDRYQQLLRARDRYKRYLATAGSLHDDATAAMRDAQAAGADGSGGGADLHEAPGGKAKLA